MQSVCSAGQMQGGRDYQEDRFAIVENGRVILADEIVAIDEQAMPSDQQLYLLIDGMGGMGHGDLAATETLNEFIEAFLQQSLEGETASKALSESLVVANEHLAELTTKNPSYQGMGCTLVAVVWDANQKIIRWLSVGDSPLWLYRDNKLEQLNERHTWGEFIRKKQLAGETLEQEKYAEHFDALNSAVDGYPIEHIDLREKFDIQKGDFLILASDGIETLSINQIEILCSQFVTEVKKRQERDQITQSVDSFIRGALNQVQTLADDHQDNASLIACYFY